MIKSEQIRSLSNKLTKTLQTYGGVEGLVDGMVGRYKRSCQCTNNY